MSYTPQPWPGSASPGVPGFPPPLQAPRAGVRAGGRRGLAIALLVPAILAWIVAYVVPTGFLLGDNLRWDDLLALDDPADIWKTIRFSLLLAIVPLVATLTIAPLLARATRGAGRTARLFTRGLLVLPLACYTPAAMAATWCHTRLDEAASTTTVLSVTAWLGVGLVIAVAATIHLATNHDHQPPRVTRAIIATLAIAVIATALQTSQAPWLVSGARTPLAVLARRFSFGQASPAHAVLFSLVAVLGIVATVLLLRAQIRVEYPPEIPAEPASRQPARRRHTAVLLVLGIAIVLCLGYAWFPWLGQLSLVPNVPDDASELVQRRQGAGSWGEIFLATWTPPLVGAVVGVSLSAAAGFAIGALRPLGSRSEYLLLPLAPWLLVGGDLLAFGELHFQYWLYEHGMGTSNPVISFLNLVPPSWPCVPALFFFTLLFRGVHHLATTRGETLLSPWRAFAPATPLIGAGILIAWTVNVHDHFSRLFVSSSLSPLHLLSFGYAVDEEDELSYLLTIDYPIPLLLLVIGLLAFIGIRYVDRLRIRGGRPTAETPWQLADPLN